MGSSFQVLSIVIPALDEEAAIGETIRRCLAARAGIRDKTGLTDVEVLVVSDGSSDATETIALGFDEISVLAFERNRGYGAAIRCGFEHARGDLVAFLDADGTCDPRVFADLVNALQREDAHVAMGSRLGPDSEMPRVRRIGNLLFAGLLGVLSRRSVADTASGMRVIRRDALPDLEPLPSGLHYTPAMTARILLEDKLRLVEVPMSYAERVGDSKLAVVRDGLRFLSSIVQAAMAFRPARPLLLLAGVTALAAGIVGVYPVVFYLRHFHLEEWMIYRILLASLLATLVGLLLCAAVVADRIAGAAHGRPRSTHGVTARVAWLFRPRARRVVGVVLAAASLALIWPGAVEYLSRGEVEMHWSRAVLASLLVVGGATLGITTFLLNMMDLIEARRASGVAPVAPPDRMRAAHDPS